MFKNQGYKFVLPIALAGCFIGFLYWIYITDSDPSRLFDFGVWAGIGTMSCGFLVVAGASDNTFEFGEHYNATRDGQEKQERVRGAFPIVVITLLAGILIITITVAGKYLLVPLIELAG